MAVMITPFVSPTVLSRGSPGEFRGAVGFHGRSITQLPAEVLLIITSYLSMREVLVLSQVCRDLRNKLEVCTVVANIRTYLSLSKNKRWFVHQLVTGNRVLIDHLRNNPVGYRKTFPIQHSPAIFIKYASHFREHTIMASSISLMPGGCIERLRDSGSYQLNYQHNCLIQENADSGQLHAWTNQKDGSWESEYMIDFDCVDSWQQGTNILFVAGEKDGKSRLSIVTRNAFGVWHVSQNQYLNEISPSLDNHNIFHISLAENQRVILCEVVDPDFKHGELLIFEMDDGRWRTKGRFHVCDAADLLQCRFSQDCGHVAVSSGKVISFFSRQDDGFWITTGEISLKSPFDKKNLEFSADDHHFVAWGQKGRRQHKRRSLRKNSHVIVASLDDQGQWSEVLRIKRVSVPIYSQPSPHARFSPDGNQLFVCINDELIILSLQADEWVWSTTLLAPWDGSRCIISTTTDSSLLMVTSDKRAWIYAIDASGVWGKQHQFSCFSTLSPIISADGNTAICQRDETQQIDIWSRRHPDQWIKQEFVIPATRVKFSPDGSLVALVSDCDLIFLGLTDEGLWQDKGRQTFDGRIVNFGFSPCGRSIRVDLPPEESGVISFWRIVPQP